MESSQVCLEGIRHFPKIIDVLPTYLHRDGVQNQQLLILAEVNWILDYVMNIFLVLLTRNQVKQWQSTSEIGGSQIFPP